MGALFVRAHIERLERKREIDRVRGWEGGLIKIKRGPYFSAIPSSASLRTGHLGHGPSRENRNIGARLSAYVLAYVL